MRKLYIGISGKMGSGKTTLTNGLINNIDLGGHTTTERVSLAKPIKDIQDSIYSQLSMDMEGEKDRDLLIALGMWGRGKDPDFWLKKAVEEMQRVDSRVIICDDIRFINEANWFKKNGILMRINGEQRGSNVDHNTSNVTETALDDYSFDYYLDNRESAEATLSQALYCLMIHMNGKLEEDEDGKCERYKS